MLCLLKKTEKKRQSWQEHTKETWATGTHGRSWRLIFGLLGPSPYLSCTTNVNLVVDKVHSLMEAVFTNFSYPFQQNNSLCHTAKWFKNGLKHNKFRVLTWPTNSSEFIGAIKHLWPSKQRLTSQFTGLTGSDIKCFATRSHSPPSGVLWIQSFERSELFWRQNQNLHNIRQEITML